MPTTTTTDRVTVRISIPAPRADLEIHNPFGSVWSDMINKLKSVGYTEGCDLFTAPYDWRIDLTEAWVTYLKPVIEQAKRASGKDKVVLVAHSMGGLLARAYIQSERYDGDVARFAMLGTPNHGSAVTYYLWEGGDPINADKIQGNDQALLPYFYTNTLALNYMTMNPQATPLCKYDLSGPPLLFIPSQCLFEPTRSFIHRSVPSVKQLLPTYAGALQKDGVLRDIVKEENEFLRALNGESCFDGTCAYTFKSASTLLTSTAITDKIETRVFTGIGYNTLKTIKIKEPLGDGIYYGLVYRDGEPIADITGHIKPDQGDGTVLAEESVRLNFLVKPTETRSKHKDLMNNFAENIKDENESIIAEGIVDFITH